MERNLQQELRDSYKEEGAWHVEYRDADYKITKRMMYISDGIARIVLIDEQIDRLVKAIELIRHRQ